MSEPQPSTAAGMGSIPIEHGAIAFRVWAPHAEAVFVAGTFNHWSPHRHALASEGNGFWSVEVSDAAVGDRYKYVLHHQGEALWRVDPQARDVTASNGDGVITPRTFDWGSDDGFTMPPWNELVVYELHIGTFNDETGGSPGHFGRVVERLPYLRDLGINAVQLMPPTEFAGGYSWGYNPSHIFAIETDYGGARALKALIKAAHDHGIAVIFDVVYNHLGPSDLDLWRFDGWHADGGGGIYFYNDWRATTPWGHTRPDYGRPEVRQFLRDNALMWIDEFRVDGLRWDATAYVRNVWGSEDAGASLPHGWGLMRWVNDEVDARGNGAICIAEDLRGNPWLTRSTADGGAGFGAQWSGEFVHPVRAALIAARDEDRDIDALAGAVYHRFDADAFRRVIYTESHDEVANGRARLPEEIWPGRADSWYSKKRSLLGAAVVLTAPGIPMLFQGQEFLEDEWFHERDPIDWSKRERFAGIVRLWGDLIRLRRNLHGATRGLSGQHVHVHHRNRGDKVLAYHRWDRGGPRDSVVVVLNLADRAYGSYTIGLPRAGRWRVRINSDWGGYDPEFDGHDAFDTEARLVARDDMPCEGEVGLGRYTFLVLSQDE